MGFDQLTLPSRCTFPRESLSLRDWKVTGFKEVVVVGGVGVGARWPQLFTSVAFYFRKEREKEKKP
jgi:hypothetical protein